MLNLSDKSVIGIINSDMTNAHFVATSGDKLYYTNWSTHTVTCCDLHVLYHSKMNVFHMVHVVSLQTMMETCMSSIVILTMLLLSPLMDNVIDNFCLPRMA